MINDEIIGYIDYRNSEHIFIIEKDEVKLIPCDINVFLKNKTTSIFDSIVTKNNKKGFLSDFVAEGVCLNGKKISMCLQDLPWINDGVFKYRIKWAFVYDSNIKKKDIKGLSFLSQEINYFYDTKKYVDDDFEFKGGKFKKYTVNINSKSRDCIGQFKYNKNTIKIYGDMAWKKNYEISNNLEIWSKLSLEFKNEICDIEEIYTLVLLQKNVIDVLTYRTNNGFDSIEVYTYNEKNKIEVIGNFYVFDDYDKETNSKEIKHLITHESIPNIGKLYELIDNGKIYLSHICESHKLTKLYNPPRMLGILIAFERIFNWKYDKEAMRNSDYIELLKRIGILLDANEEKLIDGLSKSKIKFAKTRKFLLEPKAPFSTYITRVINDYPITKSVISTIYGESFTNKLKNDIAERINKLRNGMAHGNMDIEFSEINTKDLKFMELLFYVLLLSELDLTNEDISKKIAWLFDIRPFIIM